MNGVQSIINSSIQMIVYVYVVARCVQMIGYSLFVSGGGNGQRVSKSPRRSSGSIFYGCFAPCGLASEFSTDIDKSERFRDNVAQGSTLFSIIDAQPYR